MNRLNKGILKPIGVDDQLFNTLHQKIPSLLMVVSFAHLTKSLESSTIEMSSSTMEKEKKVSSSVEILGQTKGQSPTIITYKHQEMS